MKSFLLIALSLLLLTACNEQAPQLAQHSSAARQQMMGLASPIHLQVGETQVDLGDYVLDVSSIDSVSAVVDAQLAEGILTITPTADMPSISVLDLYIDGERLSIPMMRSKQVMHRFEFDTQGQSYSTVQIKGELGSWDVAAYPMLQTGDIYFTEILADPGIYQYKMVLDGQEADDLNNLDKESNGMGGFNNLMMIGGAASDYTLRLSADLDESGSLILSSPGASDILVILDNEQVEVKRIDEQYEVQIPSWAKGSYRSFLRAWSSDGAMVSNDLFIPIKNGQVITDASELNRLDAHAMSLYNVFVDRFSNGDPSNDRPVTSGTVLPIANNMGGDIKGAIRKLEEGYFESLGINTIWISPIVKNVEGPYGLWPEPETEFSAYHGYWPISFTQVDDRLTTEEDLHRLVELAHEKDMNVLLDFVANHVHEEHPYYLADTTVGTPLYLPDGKMNTELWDDQRLTTWFDVFLPSLRLDEPRVYEMLSDSAVYWIEKYDFDGFRHDAAKHVPTIFWQTLTRKLKQHAVDTGAPMVYQIGETYGSHELVASYVNSGQLDAQFDFNAYDAIQGALAREDGSFEDMHEKILKSLDAFGHHHLMGNITGNQDKARFISYAGGDISFEEKPKVAGWTREIGISDEAAWDKSAQLMALTATLPGLPVIYYGDEIGSCGGGDPDNRKMMQFEDLSDDEAALKASTAALLQLRRSSMPLMYGDFKAIEFTQDTYVYVREYMGEQVLVALNRSDQDLTLYLRASDFDAEGKHAMSGHQFKRSDVGIALTVPAHGYEIIH